MKTKTENKNGAKIGAKSMMAFNFLAAINGKKFTTIPECAKKLNCSVSYLEAIATSLRKNGFIISRRGPAGGFSLAMDPKKITVGKVIVVMEGSHKLDTSITKAASTVIMNELYRKSFKDVLDTEVKQK